MPVLMHQPPVLTITPEALVADGYARGLGPRVSPAVAIVDRAVCRRLKCLRCKRRGLEYHPHHKAESYRVVAVCPFCGTCEEI